MFWQNVKVPRAYNQTQRAHQQEATRQRIVEAAIELLADEHDFQVRDIAKRAPVSLQTLYANFGSKANLVMAVVGEIMGREGLMEGIERVWRESDPIRQLEEMTRVTITFWHRAWPFISYTLKADRVDAEFAEMRRQTDASRLADLQRVCNAIGAHGALRAGLTPKTAAALAFALTAPTVYEDLVVRGHLSVTAATRELQNVVRRSVCDRST